MGAGSSLGFRTDWNREVGAVVLFLVFSFALLYGSFFLWRSHRNEVEELFHYKAISFSALTGLVAAAAALYRLRKKRIRWYAAIEFSVGLFAAWQAVSSYQTTVNIQRIDDDDISTSAIVRVQGLADPERLLKAIAAVYLMIRALDNGLKKSDEKVKAETKSETRTLVDQMIRERLSRYRWSQALREGDLKKAQLVYREEREEIDLRGHDNDILAEFLQAHLQHRGLRLPAADLATWLIDLVIAFEEGDSEEVMKNILADARQILPPATPRDPGC